MDRFAALVLTVFQRVLAVQIGLVVVGRGEPGHYSADSLLCAAVLHSGYTGSCRGQRAGTEQTSCLQP